MKGKLLIILLAAILFVAFSGAYVVDETEQVVITQFGKAIGESKREPGLYFKLPIIQQAHYFPKTLLEWDGDAGQIPTLDKTFIFVDAFARWRIVDPLMFYQTVTNMTGALARLDDIVDPAVRNLITSHPLIETVRWTNREMDTFEVGLDQDDSRGQFGDITLGRQKITAEVVRQAQPKVKGFGIEIVDVQIKRLNYVPEVQKSVYARMIAERKQIAEKFRSEGMGEARKVEGNLEKDLKKITSEAYKAAQEIKGGADAKAALIYARAYDRDPELYYFMRSLELYRETMAKDSSLVLSTDSDLYGFLKRYDGAEKGGGSKKPPSQSPNNP